MYPTAENVPRIYGSPKIHKDGTPLRPIVDYLGSIAYNVSRSLADILGPLVGKTEHHVLNSKQFAEEMTNITVEDFEIMNSHDVISLFTKTPIEQTLRIIRSRLEQDRDLKNRTKLTVNDLMELTEFVLTTTYFSFQGDIYVQNSGPAMGSPLSPIACNIFME